MPYGGLHWAKVSDYNRLMYTGQELDMDGGLQVYYYGARYYDDSLSIEWILTVGKS